MKTLSQFLSESAAQQALRLGLEGDGHGDWYKDGQFVAKTVKGKLKFYNKRSKAGEEEGSAKAKGGEEEAAPSRTMQSTVSQQQIPNPDYAAQQQQAAQQQDAAQDPAAQQAAEPAAPSDVMQPPEVEKTKGTLTIAFGRFNPPHIGHQQLMDVAAGSVNDSEDKSDYVIVPSRTQDNKKNPLDPDTKVAVMQQMFPHHGKKIVNDPNNKTIFDVLKTAHADGYANVRIVAGSDRVKEFEKLSANYNGALYAFDNVEVLSSGERDPDSDGVEGMSASRMRLAASENDFKTFSSGLPSDYNKKKAKETFAAVQQAMGVSEGWQIAPKFFAKTLRENYLSKKIYNIGDIVENINNGLVGRIIRRGANHLICVSEERIMFKSWIRDVVESTFVRRPKIIKENTWARQFINKYRKK